MKNILIFLMLTFLSSQSYAIGDKEQGALMGIFGTLLIQKINQNNNGMQYPQDTYNGRFPEFRCNGSEVQCAYERGVYDRKRKEWEMMKRNAYECGRNPVLCDSDNSSISR